MSTYLSIILTGRNDDYGGDFRQRLQNCITWTHQQLQANQIPSEIIFVNYNPRNSPSIEEFIEWPQTCSWVSSRIINISSAIHQTFLQEHRVKNVPVLEYPGKNAGIRRAKGKYILCINPDILVDPKILYHFNDVQSNCFYKANKIDFTGDWINGQFQYKRLFLKGHDYTINSQRDIQLKKMQNKLLNFWKLNSVKLRPLFDWLSWKVYYHNIEFRYHCNGSGDFMLMHRNHWWAVRGYHENTYLSLHVDALMVIQAAMLGLKEKVLKWPIYHQEHERRYDATDENTDYRDAYLYFQDEAQKMLREGQPTIYNDESWGFANFDLEEIQVA